MHWSALLPIPSLLHVHHRKSALIASVLQKHCEPFTTPSAFKSSLTQRWLSSDVRYSTGKPLHRGTKVKRKQGGRDNREASGEEARLARNPAWCWGCTITMHCTILLLWWREALRLKCYMRTNQNWVKMVETLAEIVSSKLFNPKSVSVYCTWNQSTGWTETTANIQTNTTGRRVKHTTEER